MALCYHASTLFRFQVIMLSASRQLNHRSTENLNKQHNLHRLHEELLNEILELEDERKSIEKNVLRQLKPYAQAECLHLCDQLYSKLPRELRNMVYSYIGTDEGAFISQRTVYPWCQSADTNTGYNSTGTSMFYGCRHIWDEKWTGKEIRQELVEHWYRTSHLYICDFEIINEFTHPMKALNGHAAYLFISYVRVAVEPWDLNVGKWSNLARKMESLFVFRAGIDICIDMNWVMDAVRDLYKYDTNQALQERHGHHDSCIRFIVPWVIHFRDSGYIIKVKFGDTEIISGNDREVSVPLWRAKLREVSWRARAVSSC